MSVVVRPLPEPPKAETPMPPEWKWDSLPVLKEVIDDAPTSPPPEPVEEQA